MTKAHILIREPGKLKPDYSLEFEFPELPKVGDYISIHRPDKPSPYGEDVIVRAVWWRLEHPETRPTVSSDATRVGKTIEIFIECDVAVGPYASDNWHVLVDAARKRGIEVPEFQISRFSVRESDLKK
jgi:hypothetical protein